MSSRIDTIEKLLITKEWIIQKEDIINKRHQLVVNKNLLKKQLTNQNNTLIQELQEKQQEEYREYERKFNEQLKKLNEKKEELLNEKSELKTQFINDQTLPYTKEIKNLEIEKKKKATLTNLLDFIKNNRSIPRFFYPISSKEWAKYLIICSIVCVPIGYIFPNGFALPWLILTVIYPILRLGSWITKVFFLSKFDKDISKNQKQIHDITKRINENKLTNDVLDNVTQLIISLENKITEQLSTNKLLLENLLTTHLSNYSSFNERLINQLNQKIETYLNENQEVEDNLNFELDKYNKLLENDSIVSAKYQTLKSILAIIEPLRNQQADTLKEAIEFYLNEQDKEEERLTRRREQKLYEENMHQEMFNKKEQLRIQEEESINKIQLEREAIHNEFLLKEMEIDALLQQHQDNLQLEQERINKENEMLEIQLTQQSELEILNIQLAEQQLEIERQKQYYIDSLENKNFEISMNKINNIKDMINLTEQNVHLDNRQKEKRLQSLQDELNKIILETQP